MHNRHQPGATSGAASDETIVIESSPEEMDAFPPPPQQPPPQQPPPPQAPLQQPPPQQPPPQLSQQQASAQPAGSSEPEDELVDHGKLLVI